MQFTRFKIIYFLLALTLNLCLTESYGQIKQDNSVAIKDQKTVYETPAVYELIHTAFALTDTNNYSNNRNFYYNVIDTSKLYYKEVINHFSKYKNHKLITDLNKHFKKSPMRYIYNLQKGFNSSSFNNEIKKNKRFPFVHGLLYSFNSVSRETIEDFAITSNFQSFYDDHQVYYKQVLEDAKAKLNVSNIQQWLEAEFPSKYDKFNIVISPLMNATHFTRNFKFKGEKYSNMWVSDGFGYNTKLYSQSQIAGIYTGTVFTEIDHNYVNKVSDNFKKEIEQIMGESNREKWVKPNGEGNFYRTGYKAFNEYMTHAVYLVYTNSRYAKEVQLIIEKSRIRLMEQMRKFHHFGDFYMHLKTLYTSRKESVTITSLYPQMLEWCKQQNLK